MGNYLDKTGLQRAFTKMKSVTDKKANLLDMNILTSSSTNKGKYIKFATVDLSGALAYQACSGHILFSKNEGMSPYGNLVFEIRNVDVAGTIGTAEARWLSLDNAVYAASVLLTKDATGIISFYYKPVYDWETPSVSLTSCNAVSYFKFIYHQSYVDSISSVYTSYISGQAAGVPWSGVTGKPSFSTVATSGSYNDLANKPSIPTVPSAIKNPNALTISLNSNSQGAYDGSAAKSINITASSVGAAASSHTHTKSQITDFPTSMPASDVPSWAKAASKPSYTASEVGAAASNHNHDSVYLKLSGGAMTGKITRSGGGSNISDRDNVAVSGLSSGQSDGNSYNPVVGQKTTAGYWSIGNLSGDEKLQFHYTKDSDYTAGTNKSVSVYVPNTNGTIALTSQIPSVGNGTITITQNGTSKGTFTLNQSGNTTISLTDTDTNTWRGIQNNLTSTSTTDSLSAAQGKALNDKFASYVPTSRTVNGKALSGNVTLSAGDVGAAASSHTHGAMGAATTSAAGSAGFVPAPAAGKQASYLRGDGQWAVPTNTTYSAGTGISLSGTTFSNSGVRSVATGSANGTISVNTNGSSANVAVKGLGSAAYTASTAYAPSDVIVVSSTQPTSSNCKIWIKTTA